MDASVTYILSESNVDKSTFSKVILIATDEMSELKAYLAENPRMMGALFTMVLLLSQASSVVAKSGTIDGAGP